MDGQFNYIIKYRDIYDLSHEYKWQLEELQKGIEKMKDKINAFINDSSFKGEGADSIKAYFKERHIPMLDGINQAAQSLIDNVATYKGSYYSIDFATNFILNKESIESYNSVLYKKYTDETDGYIDAAKAALDSVSDIFSDYIYPQEAANDIGTYHEGVKTRINDWTPQIQNVEYNTAYLVHQVTDAFINVIDQTNKSIGTEWADIKKYESGSLNDNVCFNSLKEISSIYNDIHNQNADVYDKIWDVERQLDEAAAQREAQGAMKIISGIGLAITGVVCIVATWGAATPVVVAGVVAGGGTLAFAAADTVEGAQDVYYGSIGDIDSTSFNGIKSLVYACGGDDDDYNNIEQAFSFAASCMAPIGTASKMGTLTTETVITTIAKEYISNEAGNLAQEITVKLTDNQIAGLVANVVASAATSKGLDMLDKPVNVDIGIDADNAKGVKTGDVDGIKPVDADIKTNVSADLPGAGVAGKVDDFAGAAGKVDDLSGAAGKVDDLSGAAGKVDDLSGAADNIPKPTSVDKIPDSIDTETFKSWDEMKDAHKGTVTKFVKDNKPKYSPDLKKWFDKGGTVEISNVDGHQIWKYTDASGKSAKYIDGLIEFPPEALHPVAPSVDIGEFTGSRGQDTQLVKDILRNKYKMSLPQGFIIHHDSINGIIKLVSEDYHSIFTHIGGYSLYK